LTALARAVAAAAPGRDTEDRQLRDLARRLVQAPRDGRPRGQL